MTPTRWTCAIALALVCLASGASARQIPIPRPPTAVAKVFPDDPQNGITACLFRGELVVSETGTVGDTSDDTLWRCVSASANTWANLTAGGGGGGFTQEEIEDFIGEMVSSNTETGIAVTYVDNAGSPGVFDFVAEVTQAELDTHAANASAHHAAPVGANPATATVGLTAVNGVATTFMRSDAAPPIDPTVVQRRVSGACADSSSYIHAINQDGTVQCDPDSTTGGGSGYTGLAGDTGTASQTASESIGIKGGDGISTVCADGASDDCTITAEVPQSELDAHTGAANAHHTPPTASTLSGVGAGTSLTADLEEENHGAEHAENQLDELLVESLGTAGAPGTAPVSDGLGGLDPVNIAEQQELDTHEGNASAHHVQTPDQVGTVADGSYCQGGAGSVLDCDVPTIPDGAIAASIARDSELHAQFHAINSGDHSASGLTTGHHLRATGSSSFAFGATQDSDLPASIARDSETCNGGNCTLGSGDTVGAAASVAIDGSEITTGSIPQAAVGDNHILQVEEIDNAIKSAADGANDGSDPRIAIIDGADMTPGCIEIDANGLQSSTGAGCGTGSGSMAETASVLHSATQPETDDLAIGGTSASAEFFVDAETGDVTIAGSFVAAGTISSGDQTSSPGNRWRILDNDVDLTPDPSCANSGEAGVLTILDIDEGPSDTFVICDGTTQKFAIGDVLDLSMFTADDQVLVSTSSGAAGPLVIPICTSGAQSIRWNGTAFGCDDITGGSASNSFETWNAPQGTDPVADSPTDTINLTEGEGIDITGTASTDTLNVAAEDASTSNKGVASFAAADFDVASGAVTIDAAIARDTELAAQDACDEITGCETAGTGLLAQTGTNTKQARTITGDSEITVANGDGVSGNPTLAIAATLTRDTELADLITSTGRAGDVCRTIEIDPSSDREKVLCTCYDGTLDTAVAGEVEASVCLTDGHFEAWRSNCTGGPPFTTCDYDIQAFYMHETGMSTLQGDDINEFITEVGDILEEWDDDGGGSGGAAGSTIVLHMPAMSSISVSFGTPIWIAYGDPDSPETRTVGSTNANIIAGTLPNNTDVLLDFGYSELRGASITGDTTREDGENGGVEVDVENGDRSVVFSSGDATGWHVGNILCFGAFPHNAWADCGMVDVVLSPTGTEVGLHKPATQSMEDNDGDWTLYQGRALVIEANDVRVRDVSMRLADGLATTNFDTYGLDTAGGRWSVISSTCTGAGTAGDGATAACCTGAGEGTCEASRSQPVVFSAILGSNSGFDGFCDSLGPMFHEWDFWIHVGSPDGSTTGRSSNGQRAHCRLRRASILDVTANGHCTAVDNPYDCCDGEDSGSCDTAGADARWKAMHASQLVGDGASYIVTTQGVEIGGQGGGNGPRYMTLASNTGWHDFDLISHGAEDSIQLLRTYGWRWGTIEDWSQEMDMDCFGSGSPCVPDDIPLIEIIGRPMTKIVGFDGTSGQSNDTVETASQGRRLHIKVSSAATSSDPTGIDLVQTTPYCVSDGDGCNVEEQDVLDIYIEGEYKNFDTLFDVPDAATVRVGGNISTNNVGAVFPASTTLDQHALFVNGVLQGKAIQRLQDWTGEITLANSPAELGDTNISLREILDGLDNAIGAGGMTSFTVSDTSAGPDGTVNQGEDVQIIGGTGVTVTYAADGSNHDLTIAASLGTLIEEAEMASEDFGDFSCGGGADDCLLDDNAITGPELADGSVGSAEIADGSVAFGDIARVGADPAMSGFHAYFGTNGVVFEGAAADAIEGTLQWSVTTTDKTITLPDQTGTLALLGLTQTWGLGSTFTWNINSTTGTDPAVVFGTDVKLQNTLIRIGNAGTVDMGTPLDGDLYVENRLEVDGGITGTYDAEAAGNTITLPFTDWYDFAGCVNGTTGTLNWDAEGTGLAAPAAACQDGTNSARATADFDAATDEGFYRTFKLPDDWAGSIDLDLRWRAAAITGDVVWAVQTACIAVGETDDPSLNTADTVTDTAAGTTQQTNEASFTGITTTGCAAGELLRLKVFRDADNGSDDMAGDALGIGLELTMRRAI